MLCSRGHIALQNMKINTKNPPIVGRKMLLFAHHQDVMDGLQEGLRARHVGLERIDGRVPPARRSAAVSAFAKRGPSCPVLLLSLEAASVWPVDLDRDIVGSSKSECS